MTWCCAENYSDSDPSRQSGHASKELARIAGRSAVIVRIRNFWGPNQDFPEVRIATHPRNRTDIVRIGLFQVPIRNFRNTIGTSSPDPARKPSGSSF